MNWLSTTTRPPSESQPFLEHQRAEHLSTVLQLQHLFRNLTSRMATPGRFANSHVLQSLLASSYPSSQPETTSSSNSNNKQQIRSTNSEGSSSFQIVSKKETRRLDSINTSGCRVAALFAHQAKITLSDKELSYLQRFLSSPFSTQDAEYLQLQHSDQLQAFYKAELQEFGGPSDRMGRPSGPENADIGIIMRC